LEQSFVGVSAELGPYRFLRAVEEAERILFLTYTANLGYFEKTVLALTRDAEAAAAIIADANMVSVDPLAVRHAGIRYLAAGARCPGGFAFHPKLLVACSRESAYVAIGSGNLTFAGWHSNHELWTFLEADRDRGGPRTVAQVADFARTLAAGPVNLPEEAADALSTTAALLERLPAEAPGPRLISSLEGPIVDALPPGPVDELIAYAPFFDPALSALESVVERLRPGKLTVFVQPQTSVHGVRLERFLAERNARLAWCAESPYRHGKLIEWSVGGERWALTGSPNLSVSALGRGVSEGGNLELGLLSSVTASLAPAEAPTPPASASELSVVRDEGEGREASGPLLLSAVLGAGGELRLNMSELLAEPVRVEAHDRDADVWREVSIDPLPLDQRTPAMVAPWIAPGTAIRLAREDWMSNVVFATDPIRVTKRPRRSRAKASGSPHEVFLDGRLNALLEDALVLAAQLASFRKEHAGHASTSRRAPESRGEARGATLADYLEACAAVADERTVSWSLALPSIPGLALNSSEDRPGGGAEAPGEPPLTNPTPPDPDPPADPDQENDLQDAIERATEHRRWQLKRFCEDFPKLDAATIPQQMRARFARYALNAIAAGLWAERDGAGQIAEQTVAFLSAEGDEPLPEEAPARAAYLAVFLAILRSEVEHPNVRDERTLRFDRACELATDKLDPLEPDRIEQLVADIDLSYGGAINPEAVLVLAHDVHLPPVGAELAVRRLAEEEIEATADGDSAVVLLEPLPRGAADWALVRAAAFASTNGPFEVRGEIGGARCRAIFHSPWLVVEREGRRGPFGSVFRIEGAQALRTLAGSWPQTVPAAERLPSPEETWFSGAPRPPRADTVVTTVEDDPT
jgi:hypothetical protein